MGQTCHRAFKLPLDMDEFARAGWAFEHERSRAIAEVDIILWDEVSMTSRFALEAVDRFLRDITKNDAYAFGKKVMLFGGDFRQTLPIVIRGSRSLILARSVKASRIWQRVDQNFNLTTNLRAINSTNPVDASTYSSWLLNLGEGKIPHVKVNAINAPLDLIKILRSNLLPTREGLIEWVYGVVPVLQNLNNRVILCPTNAVVNQINQEVLARLPGEEKTYFSVDKLVRDDDDGFVVPQDLLHATVASNLPPHELTLKVGAVVMLLRNIDIPSGLCNGCRFIVRRLMDNLIELECVHGASRGRVFWLPKMILKSSVPELASPIRRIQFPIRLAFAMTINKSQGQTFEKVGLHLPTPCFAHGQLYVAFSRVGHSDGIKVNMQSTSIQGYFGYRDGTMLTRNVVYKGVLGGSDLTHLTIPFRFVAGRPSRGAANPRNQVAISENITNINNVNRTNRSEEDLMNDQDEEWLSNIDIETETMKQLGQSKAQPLKAHVNSELPFRDTQELRERLSTFDRAGTSGLNINIQRPFFRPIVHYSSSDDDSD